MINRKEYNLLKAGTIKYVPLPDGFIIEYDKDNNQAYLSRGGKRKYAISDKFIKELCKSNRDVNLVSLLVKISCELLDIKKRLKINSKLRIKVENLINYIKENI